MRLLPESKFLWLRFSVLVLVTITLLIYLGRFLLNLQFKMLYFPSRSKPSLLSFEKNHIRLWPSCADYRGLIRTDPSNRYEGTIVVFHGNGGTAADRIFYLNALGEWGYRVILTEYPMYGGRKGQLGEKVFVSDAKETIRLAFEEYGEPMLILGESLGCGVTAAAVSETLVPIRGVILITPWDTLASIAGSKFPFLPVRLFLKDKYDSIGNLASFKGKVAIIGAAHDEVIPVRHAENLYNSISGADKRIWLIQEAGHNDWNMYVNTMWWKEIIDFVTDDPS